MKAFAHILVLYVATLAVYTCYDDQCGVYCGASIELHENADHQSDASDVCTPFCSGGCCLIHVCCPESNTNLQPPEAPSSTYPVVGEDFDFQLSEPHWQPPKSDIT